VSCLSFVSSPPLYRDTFSEEIFLISRSPGNRPRCAVRSPRSIGHSSGADSFLSEAPRSEASFSDLVPLSSSHIEGPSYSCDEPPLYRVCIHALEIRMHGEDLPPPISRMRLFFF